MVWMGRGDREAEVQRGLLIALVAPEGGGKVLDHARLEVPLSHLPPRLSNVVDSLIIAISLDTPSLLYVSINIRACASMVYVSNTRQGSSSCALTNLEIRILGLKIFERYQR